MSNERATSSFPHHLHRIENGLLAILVLVLVGLAGTQIVLRVFFETGVAWADSFSRSLVLWTGMLGAPRFALIAALALLGFSAAGQSGTAVAIEFYRLADMPALIAIPLFT